MSKIAEDELTEDVGANRNKTIKLSDDGMSKMKKRLYKLNKGTSFEDIKNKTVNDDVFEIAENLPSECVDLLIADPPYNLDKSFNSNKFKKMSDEEYEEWVESWMENIIHILKPDATVYICGDWRSSSSLYRVLSRHFKVRNRITWEREKGRGAKTNWKNSSEDIWFATMSDDYHFDVDAVKLKKQVVAPYRDKDGNPKDWNENDAGNYRLTYPSNLWTNLSVPFWSMSENTEHPTQKPEKLIAKLILASSEEGDFVFDPFLGSGTTSVVAKKLGRNYCGVELDEEFSCVAEYRLLKAEEDNSIQGYTNEVFWDRNSLSKQKKAS
jgi:site-specific DNA-methyltransferase (adenine-specific)